MPAAWLSLDEGDNDPARFIEYFITALHRIIPALPVDLPGKFQGMQPAPFGTLMLLLINEISEQTAPLVLVLDDFHAIHAESILEMLAFFLEHMPLSPMLDHRVIVAARAHTGARMNTIITVPRSTGNAAPLLRRTARHSPAAPNELRQFT